MRLLFPSLLWLVLLAFLQVHGKVPPSWVGLGPHGKWWHGGSHTRAHFSPAVPLIQVAEVSPHLEALRCRAETLARDTAQAESSFTTVKSEKDLQGLQGLLSQQQELEVRPGENPGQLCLWWGGVLEGPSWGSAGPRRPRCRKPWHATVSWAGIFQQS